MTADLITLVTRKAPHGHDCRPEKGKPCTCWKSEFLGAIRAPDGGEPPDPQGMEIAALHGLLTELANYSLNVRGDGGFEAGDSGWGSELAKKVNKALGIPA